MDQCLTSLPPSRCAAAIVELLPRLRRFARTIARNVHDADDLVQLAIERALLKYDQWRPELKFDGWMFGIMRNAWIDEVRSRARRDRIFAPEEAGATVGHDSSESQVHLLAVQRAVAELPEEQRLAVALVLVEGLSYKEAAEVHRSADRHADEPARARPRGAASRAERSSAGEPS